MYLIKHEDKVNQLYKDLKIEALAEIWGLYTTDSQSLSVLSNLIQIANKHIIFNNHFPCWRQVIIKNNHLQTAFFMLSGFWLGLSTRLEVQYHKQYVLMDIKNFEFVVMVIALQF